MAGQCHLPRCGLSCTARGANGLPGARPLHEGPQGPARVAPYFARPSFSMMAFSVFMVSSAYCL